MPWLSLTVLCCHWPPLPPLPPSSPSSAGPILDTVPSHEILYIGSSGVRVCEAARVERVRAPEGGRVDWAWSAQGPQSGANRGWPARSVAWLRASSAPRMHLKARSTRQVLVPLALTGTIMPCMPALVSGIPPATCRTSCHRPPSKRTHRPSPHPPAPPGPHSHAYAHMRVVVPLAVATLMQWHGSRRNPIAMTQKWHVPAK